MPSEAVALTETIEGIMKKLKKESERQILILSLQGYTVREISEKVPPCSQRTVYRVLEYVKKELKRDQGE
jgi:hypothetical protein